MFFISSLISLVIAVVVQEKRHFFDEPVVALDTATVTGSTSFGIDTFNGIPFAVPPVNTNRLRPPQRVTTHLGAISATGIAKICPQVLLSSDLSHLPSGVLQTLLNTPLVNRVSQQSEDCLTLNIQRPSGTKEGDKLPVFFWIFGGGFGFGGSSIFDASGFVRNSIPSGPFIFVAANHRVNGFGFLPGAEVLRDGAANLGLLDQRLALEWVADNIAKFGGDPDKVTIGGVSSGAISVFDQMALYNGNNIYKGKALFRGAIMNSGSVIPTDPVDGVKGRNIYAQVVRAAGCEAAADTLQCLREVSYETFLTAVSSVPGIFDYQSVALSYLPRPDYTALTDSPVVLAQQGRFAKVPFIVGDQEDEATLFALTQFNLTKSAQIVDYLQEFYFINAPRSEIEKLVASYPDDPSAGSPFRTGSFNNIYSQFKRLAALLGDATFTLSRRVFLETVAPQVPDAWSYLGSYNYGTPVLGTFHVSDVLALFYVPGYPQVVIQNYYISFINNLDPNAGVLPFFKWPSWKTARQLLNIETISSKLIPDNFREDSAAVLRNNIHTFTI